MISVNSYIEISPIFHMDVSLPIDVDSPVLFPSSTCKTLLGSSVVSFAKVSIIINVMKTFRLRISTDVWGYNICYLEMAKQFFILVLLIEYLIRHLNAFKTPLLTK